MNCFSWSFMRDSNILASSSNLQIRRLVFKCEGFLPLNSRRNRTKFKVVGMTLGERLKLTKETIDSAMKSATLLSFL